jgi:hypothetical protein
LRELQSKNAPKDENAPDPIDDPSGYEKYLRSKWEKESYEKRINESQERMKEAHSDYSDMEQHFVFLATRDPDLVKQMNASLDPAKFAYETAKADRTKFESEVEKRVMEKLKKEGKLKDLKAPPSDVASLIDSPGAGKNSEKPVKEITSIGDVF